MFEKVSLEPSKKIGNRYHPTRLEKSVSKMGLRSPDVGRLTMSLKNIEISTKISILEGGDFRIFENRGFLGLDQCILYSLLRSFSGWQREIFRTKQMIVYD